MFRIENHWKMLNEQYKIPQGIFLISLLRFAQHIELAIFGSDSKARLLNTPEEHFQKEVTNSESRSGNRYLLSFLISSNTSRA